MAIAVYRKTHNSFLSERILFLYENTEELFREIQGNRTCFGLNVTFEKGVMHKAFVISGLAEDLQVLDAALKLSGMQPLTKTVSMVLVDIGPHVGSTRPAVSASEVFT